jgi:hypothetical protein
VKLTAKHNEGITEKPCATTLGKEMMAHKDLKDEVCKIKPVSKQNEEQRIKTYNLKQNEEQRTETKEELLKRLVQEEPRFEDDGCTWQVHSGKYDKGKQCFVVYYYEVTEASKGAKKGATQGANGKAKKKGVLQRDCEYSTLEEVCGWVAQAQAAEDARDTEEAKEKKQKEEKQAAKEKEEKQAAKEKEEKQAAKEEEEKQAAKEKEEKRQK